ncbi:unnamed protein product [Ectocarpus sp. 4 AP-2014]
MKTTRHSREKLQKTPRHAADLITPSVEWDKSNADPAPSVTVFTNMAGAVSVTVDRESSTDAGRRLSSKLLPENLFNPFRDCRSKRRQLVPPVENKSAAATGILKQNPHVTSAAAAAFAVEGIKKGVRDALDQWALQTSRRESMVLWRHECSRYASSSRIGYHPNHPSASHPTSRPSSAATILRPFSAGRVPQQSYDHDHHQHQRASSALPPRSQPLEHEGVLYEAGQDRTIEEGAGRADLTPSARPRSAIPRLRRADAAEPDENNSRPKRGVSASAARGNDGGVDATSTAKRRGSSGSSARRRRAMRSASTTRSQSPLNNQDRSSVEGGEGEDVFDDIYEDLEEDDGELEARISIMESRFSTVGRERPVSATDDGDVTAGDGGDLGAERQRWSGPRRTGASDAPRSAATPRPPRAPPQQQQQMFSRSRPARRHVTSSARAAGTHAGEDSGEQQRLLFPLKTSVNGQQQPPRVIRSRPTSAPVAGSSLPQERQRGGVAVNDPIAPLHARRMRLQMTSGGSRPPAEPEQGGGGSGGGGAGVDAGSENQRRRSSVRDVKTAVPSWDRNVDGGKRPLSSATDEAPSAAAAAAAVYDDNVTDGDTEEGGGRLKPNEITPLTNNHSRPSSAAFRGWIKARPGARSAVSAVSSARTLGMDDPELVHLQLEMESRRGGMSESTLARMEDHYTAVVLKNTSAPRRSQQQRGRPTSPQDKKGGASSRLRVKRASSKSRSKSPRKGRKKKGGGGGKKKSGKRGGGGGGGEETAASGKVYTSAGAFMAEHFPSEEKQGVSLLGMEQEEECRNASKALSRAGLSVSGETLRRALVIPTDRPLETCLAGLPHPTEGLRDAPFPPPPSLTTLGHHHPPSMLLSSSPLGGRGNVGTGPGLGKKGGGVTRRRSPSPAGRGRRGVRGRGKKSPGGGGARKKSPTRR